MIAGSSNDVYRLLKIGCTMGEEVHEADKTLVAKCRAKGLGVCFFARRSGGFSISPKK